MYSFDSRIRYSEVDQDCHLAPDKLIDYFQDCTNFHSESIGLGVRQTEAAGRCWMILNWYIEIERMPELAENVTVTTSAYSFKNCRGGRSFSMKDELGNLLARADSLWVYMDAKKGGFAKIDQDMADRYGISERFEMTMDTKRIRIPEDCEEKEGIRVMQEHLDTNHHVNNGQYVRMALAYMPEHMDIATIKVEYRRQALLGDLIVPRVKSEEGKHLVALCGADEKPYAVIEICERKRIESCLS